MHCAHTTCLERRERPVRGVDESQHRRDEVLVPLERVQAVHQYSVVRCECHEVRRVHHAVQVKRELAHVDVHAAEPLVHGVLFVAQEKEQVILGVCQDQVVGHAHLGTGA